MYLIVIHIIRVYAVVVVVVVGYYYHPIQSIFKPRPSKKFQMRLAHRISPSGGNSGIHHPSFTAISFDLRKTASL